MKLLNIHKTLSIINSEFLQIYTEINFEKSRLNLYTIFIQEKKILLHDAKK